MTNRPEPLPRGVTDAEARRRGPGTRIAITLDWDDATEAVNQLDLLVDMLRDDLHDMAGDDAEGAQAKAIECLERVAGTIQGTLDHYCRSCGSPDAGSCPDCSF